MGWRLIYTKPATRDLEELVRYIAHDRPDAAMKLGLELVALAESLTVFPYRGAGLRNRHGARKVVRAPYVLLYRWDEPLRTIRILRFWHAKPHNRDASLRHPRPLRPSAVKT